MLQGGPAALGLLVRDRRGGCGGNNLEHLYHETIVSEEFNIVTFQGFSEVISSVIGIVRVIRAGSAWFAGERHERRLRRPRREQFETSLS